MLALTQASAEAAKATQHETVPVTVPDEATATGVAALVALSVGQASRAPPAAARPPPAAAALDGLTPPLMMPSRAKVWTPTQHIEGGGAECVCEREMRGEGCRGVQGDRG